MKKILIILIILLTIFNSLCLIEIQSPVKHTFKGKLMGTEFKDRFTRCKLKFGIKNQVIIEDDIKSYYRYNLYDTYEVIRYYGRISGKLKTFKIKKLKVKKNYN